MLNSEGMQERIDKCLKEVGQYGVRVKGGADAIIQAVRMWMQDPTKKGQVAIKFDFENAFNSVDRNAVRAELEKSFPPGQPVLPKQTLTLRQCPRSSTGRPPGTTALCLGHSEGMQEHQGSLAKRAEERVGTAPRNQHQLQRATHHPFQTRSPENLITVVPGRRHRNGTQGGGPQSLGNRHGTSAESGPWPNAKCGAKTKPHWRTSRQRSPDANRRASSCWKSELEAKHFAKRSLTRECPRLQSPLP